MDNNNIVGIKSYYYLLQQITSLLNLPLPEIRQKYINYPYCLINYFEKEVEEKSIEIRFDQEEFTLTCLFSNDGKCEFVYLFPDKNEYVKGFISYLEITQSYDYLKNRWTTSGCYIKAKTIAHLPSDICLMFYN